MEKYMENNIENNNKYNIDLSSRPDLMIGTFRSNKKGFGFVTVEGIDGDFFISEDDMKDAFDKDIVLIRVLKRQSGKNREAVIEKILERGMDEVIGIYNDCGRNGFVVPSQKGSYDIHIKKELSQNAVNGNLVRVSIESYGKNGLAPEGKVEEILGHIDDPSTDITNVALSMGIPIEFPEEVKKELEKIPSSVKEEDIKGRRDFRSLDTVTIDGEDAKDLDDAITLSYEDGIYHLGVHIADVSDYVKEGSALDREALKRGTSVYLIDSVIPMLPHQLSNGICSLNHGEDRLTLSCLCDIDDDGNLISSEVVEGVINVNERMNYTDVAAILEGDEALEERYKSLVPMFRLMLKLSLILRAKREQRGSIDFNLPETKIITNEEHFPIEIKAAERNDANRIIEDFMLMANETIAEYFFWQEIPFEYRVHEVPSPEKLDYLATFIKPMGYSFKISRDKMHPKEFQKLLNAVKGSPYENLISNVTLRSLQQARYSVNNMGHFGLAAKYYCHFTSPIRRYPDLQIHRIIKEYLHGTLDDGRISHYNDILTNVSYDNSFKERRSVDAERAVTRLKEIEYMSEHLGDVYDAFVSGFSNQNIFVQLENTIEGCISVADMYDDYYSFDEAAYKMVGKKTHRSYSIGDKVKVQLVKCDKATRIIDFMFYDESDESDKSDTNDNVK